MSDGRGENILKRILRLPYRPITRRVTSLDETVRTLVGQAAARQDAFAHELQEALAHELQEALAHELQEALADIHASQENLERLVRRAPWMDLIGAPISQLDGLSAALLNYAGSDYGFAAQRGLPFRSPIQLVYQAGDVNVVGVDSQLVEAPFIYRSLADLRAGASVLYVGDSSSAVPLALASLGYQVTTFRVAGNPAHPNLHPMKPSIIDWEAVGQPFDAAIATLGAEDLSAHDPAVMRRVRTLTAPGGRLFLTARLGIDDSAGGRGKSTLPALLLEGWEVISTLYARQTGTLIWEVFDENQSSAAASIALITCQRMD